MIVLQVAAGIILGVFGLMIIVGIISAIVDFFSSSPRIPKPLPMQVSLSENGDLMVSEDINYEVDINDHGGFIVVTYKKKEK